MISTSTRASVAIRSSCSISRITASKATLCFCYVRVARLFQKRSRLSHVATFYSHPHLPHYALTTDNAKLIRVLARQPVDMSRLRPFTEAGNREFNAPARAAAPTIIIKNSPRTYNQINVPRKYTAGRRRFTIYWTWS
jgi:hypothetical protein